MLANKDVIVKDPEILSGTPVFAGRVYRSRICLTISRADIPWMNSWMTFRA